MIQGGIHPPTLTLKKSPASSAGLFYALTAG